MRQAALKPIMTVVPVFMGAAAIVVQSAPPPVSRLPQSPTPGDVRCSHANRRPKRSVTPLPGVKRMRVGERP